MKKTSLFLMMLFASSAASWSQVTEDFENDYFPPKNWTVVYANPELQADGLMSLADNPDGSGGGKSFLFSSPAGFPDNPQQYLISPCLDVSSESVFGFQYWVPMDFSGKGAAYQVGWSVTGKAIEDFAWSETLYTGIADYYAGEEDHWAEYSKEDLPAGTRYICIAFVDETANKRLYVDNVALPALAPVSCDMPANLTYEASTNTLHWVETGVSSDYEVVYGAGADFDPETAVPVHVSGQTLYTITEFEPLTFYSAYVRAVSGTEYSDWSGPFRFTTRQLPLDIPVLEDFSSLSYGMDMPENMAYVSRPGTLLDVATYGYLVQDGYGDSKFMTFEEPSQAGKKFDEWIILRGVNVEESVSYDFSFYLRTNDIVGIDSIGMWVGDAPLPSRMEECFEVIKQPVSAEYVQYTGSYMAESTDVKYFGLRIMGKGSGTLGYSAYLACFDNLEIGLTPPCPAPRQVALQTVAADSAWISWEKTSDPELFWIEVDKVLPDTVSLCSLFSVEGGERSVCIKDLASSTEYQVRVQAVCSGAGTSDSVASEWSSPLVFKTECGLIDEFPMTESFEDFGNGCWTTLGYTGGQLDEDCRWEASSSNSWYFAPYTNGAFDGTYSLLYSSYYHDPNSYGELYSPEMDMGDADFSALSFYWWNSDPCDGSSSAYESGTTSWIYVYYTMDGSEYVLSDSIKACGCGQTGKDAWMYYERLLPITHKGYKIRAVGSWGNSEIQIDQVRVKAFDSVDVPAIGALGQETDLNDVRLRWGGVPASQDSLFQLWNYIVYRNDVAIDTVSDTVYVDEELPVGNYTYYVAAVYQSGLVSETNTVDVAIADMTVYTVRLSVNLPEARLSLDTGVYNRAAGQVFEVEALPEENRLVFEHWLIDGQETVDSLVLHRVVEADLSVLAVFDYVEYPVSVSREGQGELNWEGDSVARAGSEWQLEATAAEHWLFSHWVVNGDSSTYLSFMLDFVLETSMEIKAVFVEEEEPQPEMYTLTITKVGEGETTPSTGEYTYEAGSNVELKAVAAENWHFVAWVVGQDSVRAADTAIVMTGDLAVTAVFVENLSNENPAACQFRIYPNPAWQNFVVASDEMILRLEVFDAAGRLVFRRENVNTDRLDVDVSAWPDGVYFVLVSDSKRQSAVRRMVVGR